MAFWFSIYIDYTDSFIDLINQRFLIRFIDNEKYNLFRIHLLIENIYEHSLCSTGIQAEYAMDNFHVYFLL